MGLLYKFIAALNVNTLEQYLMCRKAPNKCELIIVVFIVWVYKYFLLVVYI